MVPIDGNFNFLQPFASSLRSLSLLEVFHIPPTLSTLSALRKLETLNLRGTALESRQVVSLGLLPSPRPAIAVDKRVGSKLAVADRDALRSSGVDITYVDPEDPPRDGPFSFQVEWDDDGFFD